MAPKKAAAGPDDELLLEQEKELDALIFVWKQKCTLQDRIVMESKAEMGALQDRRKELQKGFVDEKDKAREVTGEMSRQYREMQESFNERIVDLQEEVSKSKEEIEKVQKTIDQTRAAKDDIIRKKDDEIRALTLKMETMAFEFADMLKETLDKMSQRIEVTHSSWDRDGGKPPLMNRLKQFALHEGDQA
jgi:DNA repair exonuclease SbcCD ATPase subunit